MLNIDKYFIKNRAFRAVCIIEILILFWLIVQCLRGPYNLSFTVEDMTAADNAICSARLLGEDDEARYEITYDEVLADAESEESEDESTGITIIQSDYFTLYPGAYNVEITYISDVSSDDEDGFENSTGSLSLYNLHNETSFDFEGLILRDSFTEESQTVQIKSPAALENFFLTVDFNGGGTLAVYDIEITEICAYKYVLLVMLCLLFFVSDLIIVQFMQGRFRLTEGILCGICFFAVIPFAANYSFSGHNTAFHLNRIICLADELKQGNYFPAIYSAALNGYGYPTPLFYGQLFLYFPAILYACGFSLSVSYNAYIAVFSIMACLVMYYAAFRIFKNKRQALFAAALYMFSAVRLTDVFTRSAVGEFTALTFLPLVILGFYNIYSAPEKKKICLQQYMPLVVGLTCILLSHLLTAVMCVMVMVVYCVFNIRKTLQINRLTALLKAALLTLLINLSTLIPLIDSESMDIYVNQRVNYIQNSGTYFIQLFNVIVNNYQRSSRYNTASDEMSLSIGFSITLGLAFFIICLICRKKDNGQDKQFLFGSQCFTLTCVFLFLSTRYMPYDALDFLPESIYFLLTSYQFPWRWLLFAAVFGVFCTVYAAGAIGKTTLQKYKYISAFAYFAIAAALLINTGQIYADQLRTSPMKVYSNNSYDYNMNIGAGEYVLNEEGVSPKDSSKYNYRTLIYDKSAVVVSSYDRDGSSAIFYVQNASDVSEAVVLPINCYDNYYACDNNGSMLVVSKGEHNRISVEIPAGYEGTVKVEYHIRYRWRAAIIISVITVLYLVYYIYFRKGICRLIKRSRRSKRLQKRK